MAAVFCVPSVQMTALRAADSMNGASDRMRNTRQDVGTATGDRTLAPTPSPVSLRGAAGAEAPSAFRGIAGEAQEVKSVRNGLRVDTDEILSR
jgi:hypothetical protein